jgi:hypothetical protein
VLGQRRGTAKHAKDAKEETGRVLEAPGRGHQLS